MHWAKKAISDPISSRSFPIWYHKALAECLLNLFSDCENSLTWASVYASSEAEPYLENIYRFLEQQGNYKKKISEPEDKVIYVEIEEDDQTSELEEL